MTATGLEVMQSAVEREENTNGLSLLSSPAYHRHPVIAYMTYVGNVNGDSNCSFYNLEKSLNLSSLPSDERPVSNWKDVCNVSLDFILYTIIRLDMNQQAITTYIWFQMTWQHKLMSWDSERFCGINSLFIPSSSIVWKPDLYVYEMTESDQKPSVISYFNMKNDGAISNSFPLRVVSTCKLYLYKFPFDTQTCTMTFRSYLYTVKELVMLAKSDSYRVLKNSQEVFSSKGEWSLLNITVQNETYGFLDNAYSVVIYKITIKRAPAIYIINLIIPACFLVILDIHSMFIQSYKSRLTFKINVILGFSVLLLILNNMLPPSDSLPMLGIFCCVCIAMMVLSIIGTILSFYLLEHSATPQHVSPWLKTLVLKYMARALCFKKEFYSEKLTKSGTLDKETQTKDSGEVQRKKDLQEKDSLEVKLLKRMLIEILRIQERFTLAKSEEDAKSEWFKVAKVIDRMVLILYLLAVMTVLIILIYAWAK
ncbi:PREDICTED: 5-hydroxytryptamine receptor 3A-like [Nanorana parkeri]|uniref:5-hydroxytryptamine receptor 3A-like n=1 Tax=Nanorana parkeri TaxID=125878 RepID=UPI00085509B1|nr:PREDICTED: 5-hydroxytryptamine receptor 3A-like [Nanorana parkeri]